jgi:hypothetical protein
VSKRHLFCFCIADALLEKQHKTYAPLTAGEFICGYMAALIAHARFNIAWSVATLHSTSQESKRDQLQ